MPPHVFYRWPDQIEKQSKKLEALEHTHMYIVQGPAAGARAIKKGTAQGEWFFKQ